MTTTTAPTTTVTVSISVGFEMSDVAFGCMVDHRLLDDLIGFIVDERQDDNGDVTIVLGCIPDDLADAFAEAFVTQAICCDDGSPEARELMELATALHTRPFRHGF